MDTTKIKKGLGRGLSSLIGDTKVETNINKLPISDLTRNKFQPRKNFNKESLDELLAVPKRMLDNCDPLLQASLSKQAANERNQMCVRRCIYARRKVENYTDSGRAGIARGGVNDKRTQFEFCVLSREFPWMAFMAEVLVCIFEIEFTPRIDDADEKKLDSIKRIFEKLRPGIVSTPAVAAIEEQQSKTQLLPLIAGAFLSPAVLETWLGSGASPTGLKAEIGALLRSTGLSEDVKGRLIRVRTFLDHNTRLLREGGIIRTLGLCTGAWQSLLPP